MNIGSTVKQNAQRLIIALSCGGALLVMSLIAFLIFETQSIAQQARELLRLKEDYANYTLALRRMIAECKSENQEQPLESKKKRVSGTQDDEFLVVNRDFDYLVRGAVKYAQRYKLEQNVRDLYHVPDWKVSEHARKRPSPHLRKRSQAYTLALDSNIIALRAEHPLRCPLDRGVYHITSKFGPRKRANGSWGFHYGLDMAAPYATPVKAAAHGVVVEARFTKGFGNTVVISHSHKLKTRYAHLSKIDARVGDLVEQGQCVGRVGNTGYTRGKNGIHLHFEVLVYGKQMNPLYFV